MYLLPDAMFASAQGRRENYEGPKKKREMRPPASEANRKFSGSRNLRWKKMPENFMRPPGLEALSVRGPLGA